MTSKKTASKALFLPTIAAVSLATWTDLSASISVSGETDPADASFWENGGDATTEGTIGSATGSGSLIISAGSTLELFRGNLLSDGIATTSAVVTGPTSEWNLGAGFRMSESGITTLLIEDGGLFSVAGDLSLVGISAGSVGTATITGSDSIWSNAGELQIGTSGEGNLIIDLGGMVTNTRGTLGRNNGGVGMATVSGSGSVWDSSLELVMGRDGQGTLLVEDGGLVTAPSFFIGRRAGATGDVTVTGTGSELRSTNNLFVGIQGNGSLTVSNGGVVSSNNSAIATQSTSVGTSMVTGTGSQWNSTGNLLVGDNGDGSLTVSDGGVVSNVNGTVAVDTNSKGTVIVTGSGSQWNNSGSLIIGSAGEGASTISDGGVVSSTSSTIGSSGNGMGTVTVTGSSSQFNNTGALIVGNNGTGVVDVLLGGSLSNARGTLGNESGSNGTVTVDGIGSQWSSSNALVIGSEGTGILNVTGDGRVDNSLTAVLGEATGGSGTVNVSGTDSRWESDGNMTIGDGGTGTLNVEQDSRVTSLLTAILGDSSTGDGTVNVTGAGSEWQIGGNLLGDGLTALTIGDAGTGTLNISEGAGVGSFQSATLGASIGGTGTATITGTDSLWVVLENIVVGDAGNGTLNVEDGGLVDVGLTTIIGSAATGVGEVNVSGSGSRFETGVGITDLAIDTLVVGASGEGSLNVSEGAVVTNANHAIIGSSSGGSGVVTITGSGSQWNNNGNLSIGSGGTGTLTISDGGMVTNESATFGDNLGFGSATVTVTGVGSQWISSDDFLIRSSSLSRLNVENGGEVISQFEAEIGASRAESTGEVNVTGTGSQWTVGENLTGGTALVVGGSGTGTLNISDGGNVSSAYSAVIGESETGVGSVNISGSGSELHVGESVTGSSGLVIGDSGTGTLTLSNSGSVRVGDATTPDGTITLGAEATGTGTLNIGQGGSAGLVLAGEINAGPDTGILNFNHTDSDYFFTHDGTATGAEVLITGGFDNNVAVNHIGSGQTTFTQTSPFLGPIDVANGTLVFTGSDTLAGAEAALVGTVAGQTGTLNINSEASLESPVFRLGQISGSTGILNIDNGLAGGLGILVGEEGNGRLNISNGGRAEVGDVIVGNLSGSTGTATITGAGSLLDVSNNLNVGDLGEGTLNVENGGFVDVDNDTSIGLLEGGIGSVAVTGADSRLFTDEFLMVGEGGQGTLNVEDGGFVQVLLNAVVGSESTSQGSVMVTGSGSQLAIGENLANGDFPGFTVGGSGTGTLSISDGGSVGNFGDAILGATPGGTGTATITDTDSQWTVEEEFIVGDIGQGTLNVENGGLVDAGLTTTIGNATTGVGEVNVSGTGSQWILGENLSDGTALIVGGSGTGTLNILDGGNVSSPYSAVVGSNATGVGDVNISGSGSELYVGESVTGTSALIVGENGTGTLTLADSGSVVVGDANAPDGVITLGSEATGTGTLNIGQGGAAGFVRAGEINTGSGTGILNINHNESDYFFTQDGSSSGAEITLSNDTLTLNHIGSGQTTLPQGNLAVETINVSNGTLVVSGVETFGGVDQSIVVGSVDGQTGILNANVTGSFGGEDIILGQVVGSHGIFNANSGSSGAFSIIGDRGTGTLNVSSGASARFNNAFLGNSAGAVGSATISGIDALLEGRNITIGNEGTGTLSVQNGGAVSSEQEAFIGKSDGAVGTATVTGTDSQWIIGENLIVGDGGQGTLNVEDGGLVQTLLTATIGSESTGVGEVNVSGAGSRWEIGANVDDGTDLIVGAAGTGSLNVSNGGVVTNQTQAFIGGGSDATGTVTVAGTGSQWNNSGNMLFGAEGGTGTLTVSEGGLVSAVDIDLGGEFGTGNGTLVVTDTGSELTHSGNLSLASNTLSTVRVESGGVLNTQGFAIIGERAGNIDLAIVAGADSQWIIGENLTSGPGLIVGNQGGGVLSVDDGGDVQSLYSVVVGNQATGAGTVGLTGSGSRLLVGQNVGDGTTLTIGASGLGTLIIQDGASAQNVGTVIGESTGSIGEATVSGENSSLFVFGTAIVGDAGTGTVTVTDGGQLGTLGAVTLGAQATGSGTLNIGRGEAAGTVFAIEVTTGAGSGTINFNHTDSDYHFSRDGTPGGIGVILAGSTAVQHLGSGKTTLTANSTYTGGTTISNGTLVLTDVGADASVLGTGAVTVETGGTLAGEGTVLGSTETFGALSPGNSPGLLHFDSDLTLQSSSITYIEFESLTSFDQIQVDGTLTYGGTLSVSFIDEYVPMIGDVFDIFDVGGSIAGSTFSEIEFEVAGFTGTFDYNLGGLTVTAVPESAATWFIALVALFYVFRLRRCSSSKLKAMR